MTFQPTIRTQADLEAAWRTLMGPSGFSQHSVWLMLITSDGRPFPHLTKLDEVAHPPTDAELAGFADMLGSLQSELAPDGRVAFLRSRPGGAGLTADDRAWATALHEAGRLADVPVAVVHRACEVDLAPVPMDDLLPREPGRPGRPPWRWPGRRCRRSPAPRSTSASTRSWRPRRPCGARLS